MRPLWHTALLFCGILGPVCFLVIYFTFASISPDFDMLRQPIGRLELLNYGWIQSVNFIIFGFFTCAFAVGLRVELRTGFGTIMLPLFYVLSASGMILLGIFIHEPAHTYASIFSFVTIVAGFLLFARRFSGHKEWRHWVLYTNLCAIGMIILAFSYWYADKYNSSFAGIFEHFVVLIRMIWLVAFILKLLWGSALTPEN